MGMEHGGRVALAILPRLAFLVLLSFPLFAQADTGCYDYLSRKDFPYCRNLSPVYALHWKVDLNQSLITFGIVVEGGSWGWVGLGLSEGGMNGADIWVVSNEQSTSAGSPWKVVDYYSTQQGTPVSDGDDGQDIALLDVTQNNFVTMVTIRRKLDTCNSTNDLPVYMDTDQNVIFAYGIQFGYHGPDNRGSVQVRLVPSASSFNVTAASNTTASYWLDVYAQDPPDLLPHALTMPNYVVPTATTTYACKNFELPSDTKYHVIRYTGLSTSSLVHHIVLYSCSRQPSKMGTYMCPMPPAECSTFMAVWAPGVGNVSLPLEAGLPFGNGSSTFFTLQVHYNNPGRVARKVDSSGFVLYYTAQTRPNDMAILQLGSNDISIPPGQASYSTQPNLCSPSCSLRLNTTLNLFSNFFHMHEAGKSIITQHIRNGTELQPLGYRNNWNLLYQSASTVLPGSRQLLPGDSLITTCTYNTTTRNTTTNFGLSSQEEMCYNFLMYWPAQPSVGECISYQDMNLSSCTTGEAIALASNSTNATTVYNNFVAMVMSGQMFPLELLPNYTAYSSNCNKSGPPIPPVYHTGASTAAIILTTVVLSIVGYYIWNRYGRYEDPERQKLLHALEEAVLREVALAEKAAATTTVNPLHRGSSGGLKHSSSGGGGLGGGSAFESEGLLGGKGLGSEIAPTTSTGSAPYTPSSLS